MEEKFKVGDYAYFDLGPNPCDGYSDRPFFVKIDDVSNDDFIPVELIRFCHHDCYHDSSKFGGIGRIYSETHVLRVKQWTVRKNELNLITPEILEKTLLESELIHVFDRLEGTFKDKYGVLPTSVILFYKKYHDRIFVRGRSKNEHLELKKLAKETMAFIKEYFSLKNPDLNINLLPSKQEEVKPFLDKYNHLKMKEFANFN